MSDKAKLEQQIKEQGDLVRKLKLAKEEKEKVSSSLSSKIASCILHAADVALRFRAFPYRAFFVVETWQYDLITRNMLALSIWISECRSFEVNFDTLSIVFEYCNYCRCIMSCYLALSHYYCRFRTEF